MEWIDIVDEWNQVMGPGRRDFVHAHHLRHRASHVVLFNPQGELLLQQRALCKDVFPGLWDSSAAGHVGVGESFLDCAYRETREELGVLPAALILKAVFPATAENGWEFMALYTGEVTRTYFDYDKEEVAALQWVSPEKLSLAMQQERGFFSPTFLMIYEFLL